VILSNIDRADLESCLALYELRVQAIVTSDDVRAYKPHPAMFDAGLAATGISDRRRVLHIGDSSTSDVAGANAASIPVAWVNRTHKPPTPSATPDHTVTTLTELLPIVDRRV
jgi:2-haloacid dehalogenase/putative hydrolase of the HAD superfamily